MVDYDELVKNNFMDCGSGFIHSGISIECIITNYSIRNGLNMILFHSNKEGRKVYDIRYLNNEKTICFARAYNQLMERINSPW